MEEWEAQKAKKHFAQVMTSGVDAAGHPHPGQEWWPRGWESEQSRTGTHPRQERAA